MRVYCKRDRYRYIKAPVRFINDRFHISSTTHFCVDTGAPSSLISFTQAAQWGIPFEQLEQTEEPHRVGGIKGKAYYLEDSKIILRDMTGISLLPIPIPKIIVLGPDFHEPGLAAIPSLFGDDILSHYSLIVKSEKRGGHIIITDEDVEIIPTVH